MSKVRLSSVLGPAFRDLAHDVFAHGHTHYDLSGGRGSLKSSTVSLLVPLLIVKNPDFHALVLRKVANTMRDSVYAQYIWAIGELGMAKYWIAKTSPLELIYKPTGQKIMFRGADDPMKIKSIKVPFGYIAITHFEEKDQFAGRAEIRTILQSTMRGGHLFWNFESYNPPISRDNWANIDSAEDRPDRLCHKSTYLQAPPEWLGEQFFNEAEHLKNTNYRAYEHEYLGKAIGTGGNVFENLELRDISDEEIKRFDRIYQGVDYGWFPDPFAFIRVHYDVARETIYLIDEHYVNKETNETTGRWILNHGYNDVFTICDSAEPKSVTDYRSMGINAKEAVKGPGSVDYGMKWLQKRKIVIDKRRTPHAYEEFVNYEYEKNKNDEWISGYPDANNHCLTGDTLIETTEGPIPIKELVGKEGLLHCFDEETQKPTTSRFYDVRQTGVEEIYEFQLEDGRKLQCSGEHPVLTKKGWVEAADLAEGDEIITIWSTDTAKQNAVQDHAETVYSTRIVAIKRLPPQPVYNMEVEKHHNFAVNDGLIVHNCIDALRYAMERVFNKYGNRA